jgi:hypothetical protein
MGSRRKNYYNALFCQYGFEEIAARVQDLYLEGHHREAVSLISDEMVDLVTICGPLERCRERLQQLAATGLGAVALQLQALGDEQAMAAAVTGLSPAALEAAA